MPSRAYTSFLQIEVGPDVKYIIGVNALSGLYLISTSLEDFLEATKEIVSMPSRAYTSFLQDMWSEENVDWRFCVNALSGLYLISTRCRFELWGLLDKSVNALSGLYLISTSNNGDCQKNRIARC